MIHFSKTHPSSLNLKGGSTAFPKPLFNSLYDPFVSPCRGQKPQGTGDIAGCAPSPPEFLYRQRSLYPQGVADEYLTQ